MSDAVTSVATPPTRTAPAARAAEPAQPTAGGLGAIEIRNFSFWYGERQALFDIDLNIAPRAITAFIGPSGCGKSTLLRSINRLNETIPGARHGGARGKEVAAGERAV